jgi:hypothetical protein
MFQGVVSINGSGALEKADGYRIPQTIPPVPADLLAGAMADPSQDTR